MTKQCSELSVYEDTHLALKVSETKIAKYANCIDLDEVAHDEPPHLDLMCLCSLFHSVLFYHISLAGRRGTTDEFATIPFHLVLFSAALVELAKSIPVYSLIFSSHLFFCLPLFLFPFTVSSLNQKTLRHGQTILVFIS